MSVFNDLKKEKMQNVHLLKQIDFLKKSKSLLEQELNTLGLELMQEKDKVKLWKKNCKYWNGLAVSWQKKLKQCYIRLMMFRAVLFVIGCIGIVYITLYSISIS